MDLGVSATLPIHKSQATADSNSKCEHDNGWSHEDPIEKNWIYSSNVQIFHSTYIAKRKRSVYFRKTDGACNCIHLYDGKMDLLMPVFQEKRSLVRQNNGRLGYTCQFVSVSLLSDFANDFFKTGTTMRGFLNAHNSKCTNKYGMSENEILSWNTWQIACNDFFMNVLTIDEKKVFQCLTCGPRPNVLVIEQTLEIECSSNCKRTGS